MIQNRKQIFAAMLFGAGVVLLGEHIYYWGCSFSWPPIYDHGLYGLIAIIISFVLLIKKEKVNKAWKIISKKLQKN